MPWLWANATALLGHLPPVSTRLKQAKCKQGLVLHAPSTDCGKCAMKIMINVELHIAAEVLIAGTVSAVAESAFFIAFWLQ